jgi:Protein of unknown function (DUF3830)
MRKLLVRIDGRRFPARLHEDKASKTCDAIMRALPINGRVIHARWSGEAMWLPMERHQIKVGFENQTSHPSKGELLYYPGLVSEKELLIPYGACSFASKAGVLAGNHFASISEKLDTLAALGTAVLWEGAKEISISAI